MVGVVAILALVAMAHAKKKNVLFLVSDDMRPEMGPYGSHHMITPNFDALANESLVFERAYIAVSLCMPSRQAFLTSRRPDTTKNYVIDVKKEFWRRTDGPNATSLPEYFKNHHYRVWGMGKVFHGDNDLPYSWSDEMGPYYNFDNWSMYGSTITYKCFDVEDDTLGDGIFASKATDWINMFAADQQSGQDDRPFFLAVGFHRPHIPYLVPSKYCDMYPNPEDIPLAPNPYAPKGMPDVAYSVSRGLTEFQDISPLFENISQCWSDPKWAYTDRCYMVEGELGQFARNVRRNYWAAISYIDAQVGRLVQALKDANLYDDTIISFVGDHGYQIGDHGAWEKYTNFEHGTRIPWILRDPDQEPGRTPALVESVDIYPTLVDLAGLPSLPQCAVGSMAAVCTEGHSAAPLYSNPQQPWKSAAFSQYARPAPNPDNGFPADTFDPPLHVAGSNEGVMGFTIRTDEYRYTEWVWFDPATATANWTQSWGTELYDHTQQPVPDGLFNNENENLVTDPSKADLIKELSQRLHAGWRQALPPSP